MHVLVVQPQLDKVVTDAEGRRAWRRKLEEASPDDTFEYLATDAELPARIADADVVAGYVAPEALAQASPRLKWVHSWAAGPDKQLFDAFKSSDIILTCCKGNGAVPLAEHAIMLMLMLQRDAVRWLDEQDPQAGLLFDGRIAEDFKLTSGTWVNVGSLRVRALEALAPVAQDIVVCGHDRDDVRLLLFPNLAACRSLAGMDAETSVTDVLAANAVRDAVTAGLHRLQQQTPGSSTCAAAALLMPEPPSIDAGEITDKGYINQRAVLGRRAQLVAALYQAPVHPDVIVA